MGDHAVDPIDKGANVRAAKFAGLASIMGAVDRLLVGGVPRLPAVIRHRIGTALDRSLDDLLMHELNGDRLPGADYSDEEIAVTIDRVFADWEASIHAIEGQEQRARRMEVTMASCVRLLLDAEEAEWSRFRRGAVALACQLFPSTDTALLHDVLREQYQPATMFQDLVKNKSASLSASRAADGCLRLILAADLHRGGYGAWSLWLMDVCKEGASDPQLYRPIPAFEGALLARAAVTMSAASDEDRVQWLARGAMHTLSARHA